MQVIDYDSTTLWLEGFKSNSTKKSYQVHLARFCEFHSIQDKQITPDDLIKLDTQTIKMMLLKYVIHLKKSAKTEAGKPKKGEICVNSIPIYLAGIYSFLEHHEISIPKKTIERYFPEQTTNSFRAYTRQEISKLLSHADLRERCIILLMASSGIRVGAFRTLKWKHLIEMEKSGIGLLIVYGDSKEFRYLTFVTPECLNTLKEYRESRKREGEKIGPESPIIRDKVAWMSKNTNRPRQLTEEGVRPLIYSLMDRAGIARQDIQPNHAFRKFFNTTAKNAGVEKDFKELFMGHSIDLDDVYYDVNDEASMLKLQYEYSKAVDALTISDEARAKLQLKEKDKVIEQKDKELVKKEEELSEMATLKHRIEVMEEKYAISRQFNQKDPHD